MGYRTSLKRGTLPCSLASLAGGSAGARASHERNSLHVQTFALDGRSRFRRGIGNIGRLADESPEGGAYECLRAHGN